VVAFAVAFARDRLPPLATALSGRPAHTAPAIAAGRRVADLESERAERHPGVRIPPLPPFYQHKHRNSDHFQVKLLATWRLFLISTAEMWGWRGGDEWMVSHYLLGRRGEVVGAGKLLVRNA
jgi:hypothetical protein